MTIVLEDDSVRMKTFRMYCPSLMHHETVAGCIADLEKVTQVDELWLDHDLGGEMFVESSRPDCGYEVVRFLVKNMQFKAVIRKIYVHSHNRAAATGMVDDLKNAGYNVEKLPFWRFKEYL